MKVIVAGSRTILDYKIVGAAITSAHLNITELVSGGAIGPDRLGERWALEHRIPIKRFLPNWDLGKQAGIIRNKQMGDYADALIAIWDGVSKGTGHMIEYAMWKELPVVVSRPEHWTAG